MSIAVVAYSPLPPLGSSCGGPHLVRRRWTAQNFPHVMQCVAIAYMACHLQSSAPSLIELNLGRGEDRRVSSVTVFGTRLGMRDFSVLLNTRK